MLNKCKIPNFLSRLESLFQVVIEWTYIRSATTYFHICNFYIHDLCVPPKSISISEFSNAQSQSYCTCFLHSDLYIHNISIFEFPSIAPISGSYNIVPSFK